MMILGEERGRADRARDAGRRAIGGIGLTAACGRQPRRLAEEQARHPARIERGAPAQTGLHPASMVRVGAAGSA